MLELFKKKEKKRNRIAKETKAFKQDWYIFYVTEMEDKTIQFWAHAENKDENPQSIYLGDWDEEKGFIPSEDFRQIHWYLQRGAERLRRKMMGLSYNIGDW